jgi:aminoglycoside phosphotransferase
MTIDLTTISEELRHLLGNETWHTVTTGCSGTYVFRIGEAYLKINPISAVDRLDDERTRLEWLQGRLPVPRVLYYGADASYEYLLLSAIPGIMACEQSLRDDIPKVVHLLAQGLRMIHSVPIHDCPFDRSLPITMELARQRVEAGLVDESDFGAEQAGKRASDLYAELLPQRPQTEELVFTHGDYCLPNILLDWQHNCISGFIDLARAGIADRYHDLALAARSLAFNFDARWIPLLFQEYGLAEPDEDKIRFYKLLDEFF